MTDAPFLAPPVFPTPAASPWRRVGAMLIDGVMVASLALTALTPVSELFQPWSGILVDPPQSPFADYPLVIITLTAGLLAVCVIYCLPAILPGRSNGRTLGHLLCRTRMVRLDGRPVNVLNIVRRWGLAYVLPLALIPIFPVVFFPIVFIWFVVLPCLCFNRVSTVRYGTGSAYWDNFWQGQGDRSLQDYWSGLQVVDRSYAPLPGPGISYTAGLKAYRFVNTPENMRRVYIAVAAGAALVALLVGWVVYTSIHGPFPNILVKLFFLVCGIGAGLTGQAVIVSCFRFEDYPDPPLESPAPGFYPCPPGSPSYRYFDGSAWTSEVRRGMPKWLLAMIIIGLFFLGPPLLAALLGLNDYPAPPSSVVGILLGIVLFFPLLPFFGALLPFSLPPLSFGRFFVRLLGSGLLALLTAAAFFYLVSIEPVGFENQLIGIAVVLFTFFWVRAFFSLLRQSVLLKRQGSSWGEAWAFLTSRLLALVVAVALSVGGGLVLAAAVSRGLELKTLSPAKIFSNEGPGGGSNQDANKLSEDEFKSEINKLADSVPPGTFLNFDQWGNPAVCSKPTYNISTGCRSLGKTPPFDINSLKPLAGYPRGTPAGAVWVTEIGYNAYAPLSCKALIWQDKSGVVLKVVSSCDK